MLLSVADLIGSTVTSTRGLRSQARRGETVSDSLPNQMQVVQASFAIHLELVDDEVSKALKIRTSSAWWQIAGCWLSKHPKRPFLCGSNASQTRSADPHHTIVTNELFPASKLDIDVKRGVTYVSACLHKAQLALAYFLSIHAGLIRDQSTSCWLLRTTRERWHLSSVADARASRQG